MPTCALIYHCNHFNFYQQIRLGQPPYLHGRTGREGAKILHPDVHMAKELLDVRHITDIEQVLREKKSFTLRCMLDGIKELQGRVGTWNRFASSVSITSA